jgi:PIN domain nuclease of toxin-antitoxin system
MQPMPQSKRSLTATRVNEPAPEIHRLLIDTNVFFWFAQSPDELVPAVYALLEDPANEIYVSAAVAWEIAIKYKAGRMPIGEDPALYMSARMKLTGFRWLNITPGHALATIGLPAIHRDPFDRIMISQALVEGLTLVTRDAGMLTYPVKTLLA